jgi:hypothetical protein
MQQVELVLLDHKALKVLLDQLDPQEPLALLDQLDPQAQQAQQVRPALLAQ